VPANDILYLTIAAMAPSTINGIKIRHAWFAAIFLFCGVIVLSNLAHFIVFRVLRRKEKQSKDGRWGSVQQYLSHPARAIFLITSLLIALPIVPQVPAGVQAVVRQGLMRTLFRFRPPDKL
jgi:hypothetical protein